MKNLLEKYSVIFSQVPLVKSCKYKNLIWTKLGVSRPIYVNLDLPINLGNRFDKNHPVDENAITTPGWTITTIHLGNKVNPDLDTSPTKFLTLSRVQIDDVLIREAIL